MVDRLHTALLVLISFIDPVEAHVPTYSGGCRDNCCSLPRHHTTSQVVYLRGTGGVEIHLDSETSPINIRDNEILDVDAVFREPYDQSTYDLYIGCGGCMPLQDALVSASKVEYRVTNYEPAQVEPFTQTAYRSVLSEGDRKFPSMKLALANCLETEKHFTIRLVDHGGRPDGKPIVWAPVVGLGERFTPLELLEFPVYILRNHGDEWNELWYTYWLWLFVGAPLTLYAARLMRRSCGGRPYDAYPGVYRRVSPREVLYEVALIGFVAAALEELTHLIYAQEQSKESVGGEFWVGFFLVIVVPQGLGVLFVYSAWWGLRNPGSCVGSPWWAPLEIVTGVGFLFLFGAGFYVGPAAIIAAGVLRLRELWETVSARSLRMSDDVPLAAIQAESPGSLPALAALSLIDDDL